MKALEKEHLKDLPASVKLEGIANALRVPVPVEENAYELFKMVSELQLEIEVLKAAVTHYKNEANK